uniref:peptidylprolyl isomerase n=1 Tax=Prymnesium polylepis TaxID=72548 RepID=A0A7S4HDP8_9EUKA
MRLPGRSPGGERRAIVQHLLASMPALLLPSLPAIADSKTYTQQPALAGKDYGKTAMSYSDFTAGTNGLLFKDGKPGTGQTPAAGDRVVIDWTGYTIGYFGRPFETKKLRELDAKMEEFLRFELGSGVMIPALEQGVVGMQEGGVRQLVVPPALGYPEDDPSHERVGPKPTTFSGQRALNFVLQNTELIDKTLLFNIKLVRVDKPGQNGWKRGAA